VCACVCSFFVLVLVLVRCVDNTYIYIEYISTLPSLPDTDVCVCVSI